MNHTRGSLNAWATPCTPDDWLRVSSAMAACSTRFSSGSSHFAAAIELSR